MAEICEKNVSTSKRKIVVRSDVKNYIEFCSTLGLKQLVKVPTYTIEDLTLPFSLMAY